MSYRVPPWPTTKQNCLSHNADAVAANAEIYRLERERNEARAEVETLRSQVAAECEERAKVTYRLEPERKAREATKDELEQERNLAKTFRENARAEIAKLREQLRAAAPAPLPASVEALLWAAPVAKGGTEETAVVTQAGRYTNAWSDKGARMLVDDHNAAIRAAVDLTRKGAAPVDDDGRRYRLVYADGQADAGEDFSPGSLFTWRTALEVVRVFEDNPAEANVRAALVPRLVAPHVHEHDWQELNNPPPANRRRICMTPGCLATQTATWADEPAGKKVTP